MAIETVRALVKSLYAAGVNSVNPALLIRSSLKANLNRSIVEVNDIKYDLNSGKCFVIGFGKAVLAMAKEAERILLPILSGGLIIVPHGSVVDTCEVIEVCQAARNNLPDMDSVRASSKLVSLVKNLSKNDLVICLISGGGSALLTSPKDFVSLEEKLNVTKLLGNVGADIRELNCVRKKLSLVKGGRLAEIIYPARTVSLILSDIVGDPIDLIASGPTAENSSPLDADQVVSKYNIVDELSPSILSLLKEPYSVDKRVFDQVQNVIVGSNSKALAAMSELAQNNGYSSVILSSCVEGDVAMVADLYWKLCKALCCKPFDVGSIGETIKALNGDLSVVDILVKMGQVNRLCLFAGGETTVQVSGKGKGGRNQELALRFASLLGAKPIPGVNITFLSAGSDGIDGPTDAAGAIAYNSLTALAAVQGLDPDLFISSNNSYNFFQKLNSGLDHVITGHSGTNVMDFHIMVIDKD